MSITKAANRRDRPWDDNWNNLDDSNQGWADMGQIGLDGEHTARHGGGASAESTAAPGHEVGNGSSDGHEARDLLEDEHHGLVDDDPDEDENHGANAHEPRDGPGPGHDHQGLPGDDHARSGQSDDAHEVQNGLDDDQLGAVDDGPDDDENHGANADGPQDLPGDDHAHSHRGGDTHEAQNGVDDDQQGLVDDDENHGEDHAHSSQSGDAHEARDGQDDEHQGVVDEDPNDDDLDEDEDHEANAHDAREGSGHDHQGLPGDDHAHSGQGGDAHEARDDLGEHQDLVNDALDDDEDHGANAHETRDGPGHHCQGLDEDEHGSHQAVNDSGKDRSDGYRGSSRADTAWGDGADTFVWSDTFKQGVGANHASVDEGDQPEMSAFSEDSAVDQGSDLHCDGGMPDMMHNSVIRGAVMDHWFV